MIGSVHLVAWVFLPSFPSIRSCHLQNGRQSRVLLCPPDHVDAVGVAGRERLQGE